MSSEKQVSARAGRDRGQAPKASSASSNGEETKSSKDASGPVSAQRRQLMSFPHHKLVLKHQSATKALAL